MRRVFPFLAVIIAFSAGCIAGRNDYVPIPAVLMFVAGFLVMIKWEVVN